ncbi:phage holin [Enterococcus faecium]|uniref:phage holin n=1 Tax=Enterococcus faecium TaxID=1352 RepID=UPI000BF1765D|nr:phage holin [Enterococcus faecium]PEH48068.1 phage holin [Enterococcus faecium]PEH48120.1 phage holin [Enterococcus faecium]
MKSINWKVRLRNKSFWLAIVPAALLLIQVVAVPFGYEFKIEGINNQLIAIVNAVFAFLSILGVVTDPTTNGVTDSEQALNYSKPKKDETGGEK